MDSAVLMKRTFGFFGGAFPVIQFAARAMASATTTSVALDADAMAIQWKEALAAMSAVAWRSSLMADW
jgi:hypothetical protein